MFRIFEAEIYQTWNGLFMLVLKDENWKNHPSARENFRNPIMSKCGQS